MQVARNHAAFEWGRRAAHDLAAVQALTATAQVIQIVKRPALDETIAKRIDFLTAYQDAAYAQRYRDVVERVRAAEAPLRSTRLTEAVARYLFKLMAYKDEYEVARLHADPAFHARLAEQFEGEVKLQFHLAPPLLARRNERGELQKRAYGPWVLTAFRGLAKLKGLRGRWCDPFGHTEERRGERALIGEYRATVEELLAGLAGDVAPARLALAVQIASLPEQLRGYGHVRARHLAEVRRSWATLLAQWRGAAA